MADKLNTLEDIEIMSTVWELFFSGIYWCLVVASAASMVFNLILIISPDLANQIRLKMDRSINLRKRTKPLEIPRDYDEFFFKNRVLFGILITCSSIYLFYFFTSRMGPEGITNAVSDNADESMVLGLLFHAMWTSFSLFSVICALVGIGLLAAPGWVRKLNSVSNTWLSTRKAMRKAQAKMASYDETILRHNVFFGIFFFLFSLTLLVFSLLMLFG